MPVESDTDPGDDKAEAVLWTGPDLYLEKWLVGGELSAGKVFTVGLRFGNRQPGFAGWWRLQGTAWLTDTLPGGLEFLHSEWHFCGPTRWCDATPIPDGNKLVWELGPLWPGEWNEIYVTLRIPESGGGPYDLTNEAVIASDLPEVDIEPFTDNNFAKLELHIDAPYKLHLPIISR